MKIQLEKQIEVFTPNTIAGLNAIIEQALRCKSVNEFDKAIQTDDAIQDRDFLIYFGGSHVAIHEILPNGETSERLLFIS